MKDIIGPVVAIVPIRTVQKVRDTYPAQKIKQKTRTPPARKEPPMSIWHEVHCDVIWSPDHRRQCHSHMNHNPSGWSRKAALADARLSGWKLLANGDAVCPNCLKKGTPDE